MMKRNLLMFCFSLATYTFTQAQTCPQVLRLARSTYEQGRLHELESLLKGCLDGVDFSSQERVEAYKLLTLSYIYLEEPEKADETMLKLLQTDHYFVINPAIDPAEFVALYNSFRHDPIYRIGIKAGSNITQPGVSSYNAANEGTNSYQYKFGFNFLVSAEFPLAFNKKLTFNPELGLIIKSFGYSSTTLNTGGTTASETIGKENQTWISLPVSLQYRLSNTSKFNPYVSLGASAGYLLSSSIDAETKRPGNQAVEAKTFDAKSIRQSLNISVIGSAGIKLEVKGGYFTAEARLYYGLSKINSRESLLANQFLVNDYQYVDGIFSLNSVALNIGYTYNIFKPVKLRPR